MKKTTVMPDDYILGAVHSLFNAGNGHENQEYLLFITSVEELSLKAVNYKCFQFFKNNFPSTSEDRHFFNDIIHPEDHPLFLHLLNNTPDPADNDGRGITIRVRSPFGYWKNFIFKSRPYTGFQEGDEEFMLTLAVPVEPSRHSARKGVNIGTEKSLQESLNKYKVLVNSLDQGFGVLEMIFDLEKNAVDYLFVEVNPAFEQHTGVHDPVGKTMRELYQRHETHWYHIFGQVVITGEAVRFEDYAVAQRRWFDVYAFPLGSQRSRKVACLFSDITSKKDADEKLKKLNEDLELKVRSRTSELEENNELLQMVFDTVNQGIFLMKPLFGENYDVVDFTYVRVNKVVNRYYHQRHMTGRSFLKLNPHAAQEGVFEFFKQTMITGESCDFEVRLDITGKKNWFKITGRRQKGLLICSLENVTREKKRAKELKETIRFKRQLIQTSPDLIMILNVHEEKVSYINRDLASEGMTTEKVEGMPLKNILHMIHPQDRHKSMEFHKRISEATDQDVIELEFRMRGTDRLWECFSARGKVFMRNKTGEVQEYIILLRNIQAEKMTQQALISAEKLSIKGEIARTLAHELRNPLASIGMSADILEKVIPPPQKKSLQNYIEIIKRSTTTLNNLVTDLLSVSNYTKPKMEKCCLAKTTNKALAHAKDRIFLTGITVIKKYRGPYYIHADEEKLKIAILNIIVNASEAITSDEGKLLLIINKKKNNYLLTINDNGCGMEPDQLDRLFESFYTRKPGGMGIGLSSVKNILDEHGATVKVQSVPQEGTTFIITFPCYEEVLTGK